MISHENLMKNGFIRINISLSIGKNEQVLWKNTKTEKVFLSKIIVFWWEKCGFFRKNQGKDHFIREKHIGKCDKTHGFSVEAAHDSYPAPCLHIDNQEYLRGVLLFEKLY